MPNYPDTPRRVPPGLLKSAAFEFRNLAEKHHGCNIGMGAVDTPIREPCDCHYGRLADECWLAYLDSEAALQEDPVEEMRIRKDAAYLERNQVVAALAALALRLGYRVGCARTAIEGWNEAWHGCVYIDLPTGQVSWHFHDDHANLFESLPPYEGEWDGHTTPEKYERIAALIDLEDTK